MSRVGAGPGSAALQQGGRGCRPPHARALRTSADRIGLGAQAGACFGGGASFQQIRHISSVSGAGAGSLALAQAGSRVSLDKGARACSSATVGGQQRRGLASSGAQARVLSVLTQSYCSRAAKSATASPSLPKAGVAPGNASLAAAAAAAAPRSNRYRNAALKVAKLLRGGEIRSACDLVVRIPDNTSGGAVPLWRDILNSCFVSREKDALVYVCARLSDVLTSSGADQTELAYGLTDVLSACIAAGAAELDPEVDAELLAEMAKRVCVSLDGEAGVKRYRVVIAALCERRHHRAGFLLTDSLLRTYPGVVDRVYVKALLDGCRRAGLLGPMREALDMLATHQRPVEPWMLTFVMRSYSAQRDGSGALELLRQAVDSGWALEPDVLHAALEAQLGSADLEGATLVLQDAVGAGIVPTSRDVVTLLALCEELREVAGARELLEQSAALGVVLDDGVFVALTRVHTAVGDLAGALQVPELARSHGVRTSPEVVVALMGALVRDRRPDLLPALTELVRMHAVALGHAEIATMAQLAFPKVVAKMQRHASSSNHTDPAPSRSHAPFVLAPATPKAATTAPAFLSDARSSGAQPAGSVVGPFSSQSMRDASSKSPFATWFVETVEELRIPGVHRALMRVAASVSAHAPVVAARCCILALDDACDTHLHANIHIAESAAVAAAVAADALEGQAARDVAWDHPLAAAGQPAVSAPSTPAAASVTSAAVDVGAAAFSLPVMSACASDMAPDAAMCCTNVIGLCVRAGLVNDAYRILQGMQKTGLANAHAYAVILRYHMRTSFSPAVLLNLMQSIADDGILADAHLTDVLRRGISRCHDPDDRSRLWTLYSKILDARRRQSLDQQQKAAEQKRSAATAAAVRADLRARVAKQYTPRVESDGDWDERSSEDDGDEDGEQGRGEFQPPLSPTADADTWLLELRQDLQEALRRNRA